MPNKTIECPKCKTINDAKSKFCKKCGASLKPSKIKCPKCGTLNDADSLYCSECGNPTKVVSEPISPTQPKSNIFKIDGANSFGKNIALVLMGLAVLLAFIGIFGDFVKSSMLNNGTLTTYTYNSLSYFFKDCWDALSKFKELLYGQQLFEAYGLQALSTLLLFISFLVAFVGVIAVTFYAAYVVYKNVSTKTTIPTSKLAKFLLAATIPYVMLIAFLCLSSSNTTYFNPTQVSYNKTVYGWGAILIIISLFFAVGAYLVSELANKTKEQRLPFALSSLTVFLMVFCVIFGFGKTAHGANRSSYMMNDVSSSIFDEFLSALTFKNYETGKLIMSGSTRALFIFSIIFMFAVMLCVIFAILAKNDKKRLISFVLIVVLSIISGVLFNNAIINFAKDSQSTISGLDTLASSYIVNIVLGAISCISTVFALALDKRVEVK